ncbi:glycosyl hydrolase family 20, catalytic domain-containing protein [Ditylenchus destructor]|uniref:beta-N-acetylhexosaminidase n=1 Tax=Ditylenchus destructor TaxID=166010 RepID=A0AAD4MEM1_9BILA|nr:glycosyl hydrolase family 20, catalytic domain-containing protein [Ditylenchus destructor]
MTNEAKLPPKGGADPHRWLTAERAFDLQADGPPPGDGRGDPPQAGAGGSRGRHRRSARGRRGDACGSRPGLGGAGIGGARPDRGKGGRQAAAVGPRRSVGEAGCGGLCARRQAGRHHRPRRRWVFGASHALRSLAQQAAFENGMMKPLRVEDAPRWGFRGLHLDVGRNSQNDRAEILKLVDAMAAFKLNKLHLHLAEDEGWRIEIPALPELAQIGGKRCHDPEENVCLLPHSAPGRTGPATSTAI